MELLNPRPSRPDGGSGDLQAPRVWEKPRPPFGAASAGFCLLWNDVSPFGRLHRCGKVRRAVRPRLAIPWGVLFARRLPAPAAGGTAFPAETLAPGTALASQFGEESGFALVCAASMWLSPQIPAETGLERGAKVAERPGGGRGQRACWSWWVFLLCKCLISSPSGAVSSSLVLL